MNRRDRIHDLAAGRARGRESSGVSAALGAGVVLFKPPAAGVPGFPAGGGGSAVLADLSGVAAICACDGMVLLDRDVPARAVPRPRFGSFDARRGPHIRLSRRLSGGGQE